MNTLHDSDEQKLRDTYLKVRNMRGGPGVRVHHERDSVVISLMPRRRRGESASPGPFWAKITGSLAMSGEDNRWQYAWSEQVRTATGWETPTGGRSGTTEEEFALNAAEANNDAAGVQGHGVDIDGADYPAGFEMQPIQGERVVRMWQEAANDGTAAYSFEATNADDGTCAA